MQLNDRFNIVLLFLQTIKKLFQHVMDSIIIWDANTGEKLKQLIDHINMVSDIAFSKIFDRRIDEKLINFLNPFN